MEDLKIWINENKINCAINSNLIIVPKFGTFIFIEEKNGKIISNADSSDSSVYYFILNDDEYDLIENNEEIKYILFKWGSRFFYAPLKKNKEKDQYNNVIYNVEFNQFLNIGDYIGEEIEFVNLGVHTGYELLNGSAEPKNWVKKASFFNQKSLGVCDRNSLASSLAFQLECKEKEMKSILGATYSVAYNYDENEEIHELYDVKVYVKNYEGWRNILRINKQVNVDNSGFIPEEKLLEFSEGLICVIPNMMSYFSRLLGSDEFDERFELYEEFFDDVYFQIDLNEYNSDETDIENLNNIKSFFDNHSDKKCVYIPDSYYVERIDSKVKDVLNKVASKAQPASKEQYLKSIDMILEGTIHMFDNQKKFELLLQSIENTNVISEQCNYTIDTGVHKLPKFPTDDSVELYRQLIAEGFEKRVIERFEDESIIQKYLDRVDEENDVIINAGFADYFLILWDVVKWAKESGILVGPGRGSVGGSLVAYLLGIIDIDPIQYDLLFERFLNKTRVSGERAKSADSLPDIDIDFEGLRRGEVKRYLEKKYGIDNVCSIGTFSRMKVKSAIKDFGKIAGLDFKTVNFATKEIPDSIKSYWKDIFDNAILKPKLKKFVQENTELCQDILGVLGQTRAGSIHPSAVLILPKEDADGNPMTAFDWLPIKLIDGQYVSEWEGKYTDRAGFLKEDILGIAQLDKFKSILNEIERNTGERIDLNEIPTDIELVFDYFKKGWNEDVFQFGTSGLKSYSKQVKPDHIEDLISMNALYRPGPMDSGAHDDFADMKHGRKKPKFDPHMKKVTKKTNGLYVFQEQVMQAMVVGGLTLSEADQVRTYMKKFDDKSLSKFKEKFINGYSQLFDDKKEGEKTAIKVWDKLYAFSAYGFNRSHAAAYTLMGYWCQFLKVCYPLEFWTASLNFSSEDFEVPNRLSEIQKINFNSDIDMKVMPPDINKSNVDFTSDVNTESIYWSLTKIKHAGPVAVNEILDKRNSDGSFFSIDEFMERITKSKVNKRVVTNLIIAGAFDQVEFGEMNEIVGDEPKRRFDLLKYYYSRISQDIDENVVNNKDVDKNWYWISLQRELTGFGEIDYKELLKNKTKVKKVLNSYMTPTDFSIYRPASKKKYDPGKPSTVVGRLMAWKLRKYKKDPNKYLYTFAIESNNSIITGIMFFDQMEKFEKKLDELYDTKDLFAIYGEVYWDDMKKEPSFRVTEDSKIIKIS